jgi:hypothetical protein
MFLNAPTNLNTSGLTQTTAYFNNYFLQPMDISQEVNDSILSYFEQQTGNKESAKVLVQAVIETAKQQREDPLEVLNKFMKLPMGDLNVILSLFLNNSRINTSYLGVKTNPQVNTYVTRTIIV